MARGPAYPYVDLEEAIGLIKKVSNYAGRGAAQFDAVTKEAWGYSPTSSTTIKVLAALKYYGLLEELDNDKAKTVKITDRAYRLVINHGDPAVHAKDLRDAALAPRWYKYCWDTWGKELPLSMRSTLLLEHGFVASTVDAFLKDYKKTVRFAGLLNAESGNEAEEEGSESGENGAESAAGSPPLGAKPQDRSGALPAKSADAAHKAPAAPPVGSNMRQDTFTLDEGQVLVQWPANLSKESFEDFIGYLELLQRKIRRSVDAQAQAVKAQQLADDIEDLT